jgi:amidase
VSHGPIIPDLFGLSTNGPIARTVLDAATLLDVLSGSMPGDLYLAPPQASGDTFASYAGREPGRLRIARVIEPVVPGAEVHPDCVAAYEGATSLLVELGHEVVDVSPPYGPDLVPLFETLWCVMATLTPVDPLREDRLQPLTRWLRDRGNGVTAPALLAAHAQLQGALRVAFTALAEYDAILHPTLALPPVPIGHFHDVDPAENFERQKLFTPFTSIYNISGQPAVSVPLHWTGDGLPIGVMLAGRLGGEGTLISLSAQLEAARPWIGRTPPIWSS